MFKIFGKKPTKEDKNANVEKAAAHLAKAIILFQTRVANWLSKYERKLTTGQKKWALAIFCTAMIVFGSSLLYRGIFSNHDSMPEWIKQETIVIPKTHPIPDSIDVNVEHKHRHHNTINKDSINK